MKKYLSICMLLLSVLLAGCSGKSETEKAMVRPIIRFGEGQAFFPRDDRIDELPDGYTYVGDLSYEHIDNNDRITEEEFANSGLEGCRIYMDGSSSADMDEDEYLYLETSTGYWLWGPLLYH